MTHTLPTVRRVCFCSAATLLLSALTGTLLATAQDSAAAKPEEMNGTKRAILLCGHPGDDEHRKLFGESVAKIHGGLTAHHGFEAKNITTFFGVDAEKDDNSSLGIAIKGPGTREAFSAAVRSLREQLKPVDSLWVIVLGHAHLEGRHSWLNLPGPDIHQDDFGKLFRDLTCREQLFVITSPASGYYIKPLSAKGRIIITATEADLEVNETILHLALAEELNLTADKPMLDADQDGFPTLFDFYIALAKNVAQRYVKDELIATEHALLDDNGDGRGTEVQLDYLTEEEGGRKRRDFQPIHKPGADGKLSAGIVWDTSK